MSQHTSVANLSVSTELYNFINEEAIPGTGLNTKQFWVQLDQLIHDLMPKNAALLIQREKLQSQIDQWHIQHRDAGFDFTDYKNFLQEIGYLQEEGADFTITSTNVDPEMASMAGPQLVVPVMNARFALNAVNARWGSLYDALYGSDILSDSDGAAPSSEYNPLRGAKAISYGRAFLDQAIPLLTGSHTAAIRYSIVNKALVVATASNPTSLTDPSQLIGFNGTAAAPTALLFRNNGLHFEIQIDAQHIIGSTDQASVKDIYLESALSTIMDCEDSVAAVDGSDKVVIYRNWLGLMRGDLTQEITKQGKTFTRSMNPDRTYTDLAGKPLSLKGRSLLFVRNVGHLMNNPAILNRDGLEVPEGIMDAIFTSLIAIHDLNAGGKFQNSTTGSMYIVKPKMHGPQEVAFADELFGRVEDMLGLERYTIKMGIMDEERRTTVNLKECIRAAKERVAFINTGFLDRTGDEIHTSMEAGPMIRKNDMKAQQWISSYEDRNVDTGLMCGLSGRAQIGKGMWAMPDLMADMMRAKIVHPKSGANTAWVPSPTAATLHAMHYHQVDVFAEQVQIKLRARANLDDILNIPLESNPTWSAEEIQQELDNNCQSLLGYVVRWVDAGIGCSKVPDINNVGLMEDRATLRISSQHMSNWIHHNICSKEQVLKTLKKMAIVVDSQNSADPSYLPMANNFADNIAFSAACELVFEGRAQPSGYTEPVLHRSRLTVKAATN
ncbi:MAG: malate synthase G [Oceanospirillaceae bacterium]|nr:malate synthase G [Oceanospirillaceae bacterium]